MDNLIRVHPLSGYRMIQREEQPEEDSSVPARINRLKEQYAETGIRRSVDAVMIVTDHGFPHVLTLQVGNAFYKLPGGYLDPSETDEQGLITRLNEQLGVPASNGGYMSSGGKGDWMIGECLSTWWRPNFDTFLYPYLPPQHTNPKEIKKLYLVHLPPSKTVAVPSNMKLCAVPIFEFFDNAARYGPQFACLPTILSRFRFEREEEVLAKIDAPAFT